MRSTKETPLKRTSPIRRNSLVHRWSCKPNQELETEWANASRLASSLHREKRMHKSQHPKEERRSEEKEVAGLRTMSNSLKGFQG